MSNLSGHETPVCNSANSLLMDHIQKVPYLDQFCRVYISKNVTKSELPSSEKFQINDSLLQQESHQKEFNDANEQQPNKDNQMKLFERKSVENESKSPTRDVSSSRQTHQNLHINRLRWRPSEPELTILKASFEENSYPSKEEKEKLLDLLEKKLDSKINFPQLARWFQHQRERSSKLEGKYAKKSNYKKFSEEQLRYLNEYFIKNTYPKIEDMKLIAAKMNSTVSKIENWFKHYRRSLAKKGFFKLKEKKYFKKEEYTYLENCFVEFPRPTKQKYAEIAKVLQCEECHIKNWYSNNRKKSKRISKMKLSNNGTTLQNISNDNLEIEESLTLDHVALNQNPLIQNLPFSEYQKNPINVDSGQPGLKQTTIITPEDQAKVGNILNPFNFTTLNENSGNFIPKIIYTSVGERYQDNPNSSTRFVPHPMSQTLVTPVHMQKSSGQSDLFSSIDSHKNQGSIGLKIEKTSVDLMDYFQNDPRRKILKKNNPKKDGFDVVINQKIVKGNNDYFSKNISSKTETSSSESQDSSSNRSPSKELKLNQNDTVPPFQSTTFLEHNKKPSIQKSPGTSFPSMVVTPSFIPIPFAQTTSNSQIQILPQNQYIQNQGQLPYIIGFIYPNQNITTNYCQTIQSNSFIVNNFSASPKIVVPNQSFQIKTQSKQSDDVWTNTQNTINHHLVNLNKANI